MSVEVVNLQGGGSKKATTPLAANSLAFGALQGLAIVNQTVSPTGGVAPYSFVGVGFPAGITIDPVTGVISGTATASGNTTASVTVTDSAAHTVSVPVVFQVGIGIFSDNLMRTTPLGSAWMVGFADPTQVGFFQGTMTETLTGVLMANPTAGGSSFSQINLPTVLGLVNTTASFGVTQQFAEVVLASSTSGFPSAGPCVGLGDPLTGGANGYFANIQPPNNFLQIRTSNVTQRLITGAGSIGTSVAVGVTVRIAVEYSGGSNAIHVYVNGVEQPGSPFTDSDATRPLASNGSLPGWFWKGCATATNIRFSNFRGGVGLG
jgi:hypothetical protein